MTNRFFICAPYSAKPGEAPTCPIPDQCPSGLEQGQSCETSKHDFRERKTGPCIDLSVIRCKCHNQSFTVYPPGHVPFGRVAVVSGISLDGCEVVETEDDEKPDDETPDDETPDDEMPDDEMPDDEMPATAEGSLFNASLMASQGNFPSKQTSDNPPDICYDTLLNRIKKALLLLGLSSDLKEQTREHIAEVLDIPRQLQIEHSFNLASEPWDSVKLGESIREILKLPPSDRFFERVAACGYLCGFWPPLHIWNPKTKKLYRSDFCRKENPYQNSCLERGSPAA